MKRNKPAIRYKTDHIAERNEHLVRRLPVRHCELKADMSSEIPLEAAANFFLANLYLKQGISRPVMSANRGGGGWGEGNLLFNVTINDISFIPVTAHRCAGGMKKLYLRSGSQRHRHFVGFFNVLVQAPTRDQPFYTVIPTHRPI